MFIVISALLFITSFFLPQLSPLGIGLFLIPLFHKKRVSFYDGFLWGLLIFSLHNLWFLQLLITKSRTYFYLIIWVISVVWLSLSSGVWLWLKKLLEDFTKNNLLSWVVSTVIFFLWLIQGSLILCDKIEGNPFLNPLLPLAYYPSLLRMLPFLGWLGLFVFLIIFQHSVCFFIKTKKRIYLYGLLLGILPFLFGFFIGKKLEDDWKQQFTLIYPWWHNKNKNAQDIVACIEQELRKNNISGKSIYLLPESSFSFNMYYYLSELCNLSDQMIILGTQRKTNGKTFNCIACLQDNELLFLYDKTHLIPFVERIPCNNLLVAIKELFTTKNNVFFYPEEVQSDVVELHSQRYQLFLCSELFFESKQVAEKKILFLWNGSWFCCDYMKKIAHLYINYFELKYQVSILACTV